MFSTAVIVALGIGIILGVIATVVWLIVFGKDEDASGSTSAN